MSAWTTSVDECAEGCFKKIKSQLSAWMTSVAECVEGFGRKDLQLSVQIRTVCFVKS